MENLVEFHDETPFIAKEYGDENFVAAELSVVCPDSESGTDAEAACHIEGSPGRHRASDISSRIFLEFSQLQWHDNTSTGGYEQLISMQYADLALDFSPGRGSPAWRSPMTGSDDALTSPHFTHREAILMRHFTEKIAPWVSSPRSLYSQVHY